MVIYDVHSISTFINDLFMLKAYSILQTF